MCGTNSTRANATRSRSSTRSLRRRGHDLACRAAGRPQRARPVQFLRGDPPRQPRHQLRHSVEVAHARKSRCVMGSGGLWRELGPRPGTSTAARPWRGTERDAANRQLHHALVLRAPRSPLLAGPGSALCVSGRNTRACQARLAGAVPPLHATVAGSDRTRERPAKIRCSCHTPPPSGHRTSAESGAGEPLSFTPAGLEQHGAASNRQARLEAARELSSCTA